MIVIVIMIVTVVVTRKRAISLLPTDSREMCDLRAISLPPTAGREVCALPRRGDFPAYRLALGKCDAYSARRSTA